MSGPQIMPNEINDEHPTLDEVMAQKKKIDETLKLVYQPRSAATSDDEHLTLNEAITNHKKAMDELKGNVAPHIDAETPNPDKTREQKHDHPRKVREARRALNEQQLLNEMRESKGLDGLRNTLNRYFALTVIGGKAK
jgi:hypothetical protein